MVLLLSRPQRFPSCRSFSVVDATVVQVVQVHVPVVAQWQFPWSRTGRRTFYSHSCCTRLSMPGSLLHRGAEADSMVQTVRRTIFFPSEHGGRRPCCAGRSGSFPRRGTEAVSMVQTVRLTMDILQLLNTVAVVPVARSCSSRVQTWRRQLSSHSCGSSFCVDTVVHFLVVVQRQMPGGSDVTVDVTSRG